MLPVSATISAASISTLVLQWCHYAHNFCPSCSPYVAAQATTQTYIESRTKVLRGIIKSGLLLQGPTSHSQQALDTLVQNLTQWSRAVLQSLERFRTDVIAVASPTAAPQSGTIDAMLTALDNMDRSLGELLPSARPGTLLEQLHVYLREAGMQPEWAVSQRERMFREVLPRLSPQRSRAADAAERTLTQEATAARDLLDVLRDVHYLCQVAQSIYVHQYFHPDAGSSGLKLESQQHRLETLTESLFHATDVTMGVGAVNLPVVLYVNTCSARLCKR